MENRIYKGKWWIPSNPDNLVSGYLTIQPNGVVKLEQIRLPRGIDMESESAIHNNQIHLPVCIDWHPYGGNEWM